MSNKQNEIIKEHISDKIRALWDVEFGLLDVRTNSSLTDSYMTMLGWYLSPVNPKDMLCGHFMSPMSDIGKTIILGAIFGRSDRKYVHLPLIVSNKPARRLYDIICSRRPDILQWDDPMYRMNRYINVISELVTKKPSCKFRNKCGIELSALNTKLIMTGCTPLHSKKDVHKLINEHMFELRTNSINISPRFDESRVYKIAEYIYHCSDTEFNAFVNKCVTMFNDNPDWIGQHMQ